MVMMQFKLGCLRDRYARTSILLKNGLKNQKNILVYLREVSLEDDAADFAVRSTS